MRKYSIILNYILYGLCLISIIGGIICAVNGSVWVDEVYSLNMIRHSWKEIIALSAGDVHPPLYYFILKLFISIGRALGVDNHVGYIILGKLVSVVPLVILFLIAVTWVRKKIDKSVSLIFMVCLVGMPSIMYYYIEIRMYSWALLFVTVAFLGIYAITSGEDTSYRAWMVVVISGVLAAYIHYFAALPIIFFFIMLFAWVFVNDRKQIKIWMISVGAGCLLYAPWIKALLSQMNKLNSGEHWKGELTLKEIVNDIAFIIRPAPYDRKYFALVLILTLLLCIVLGSILLLAMKNLLHNSTSFCIFTGITTTVWVLVLGIGYSLLVSPMYLKRYIIPALGAFWLAFALYRISLEKYPKIIICVDLLLVIFWGCNTYDFIHSEKVEKEGFRVFKQEVIDKIDENDVVVTNHPHLKECVRFYTGCTSYLVESTGEINDLETDKICYISFERDDEFLSWSEKQGYKIVFQGEYQYDRYLPEVYWVYK